MGAHDVYVSASLWDGASISLMEAMACGVFPVVSDIPANREWLQDGATAFLFPCGDWRRLAEILLGLPVRSAFVAEAIRLNRQAVVARADRTNNISALMRRLEEVARLHGSGPA
jgi:glycosyltransferase involved in cell wall biosynthesis